MDDKPFNYYCQRHTYRKSYFSSPERGCSFLAYLFSTMFDSSFAWRFPATRHISIHFLVKEKIVVGVYYGFSESTARNRPPGRGGMGESALYSAWWIPSLESNVGQLLYLFPGGFLDIAPNRRP
jgi:hypothetical protein